MHRARQRHVDQAHRLGGILQPDLLRRSRPARRRSRRSRKSITGCAVGVVVLQAFGRRRRRAAWPSHRNGQNTIGYSRPLDLWIVTICTRLRSDSSRSCAASSAAPSRALLSQPAQQRIGRGVGGGGLVQQLGQVQQVGQAALAVGAAEQARGHAPRRDQAAQHARPRRGAARRRGRRRSAPCSPAARPRRGRVACDRRGVAAHHLGGQRGAQQRVARRLAGSRPAPAPGPRRRVLSKTLACDSSTLPTPQRGQRARISLPCAWLRTSTAMSPAASGRLAERDLAAAAPSPSSRAISPAQASRGAAPGRPLGSGWPSASPRQLPQLQRRRAAAAFDQGLRGLAPMLTGR